MESRVQLICFREVLSKGRIKLAELLIQKGAKIESPEHFSYHTPLHVAASSEGQAGIIKLLLEKGANIRARDNDKRTPLHRAVMNSRIENIRLLGEDVPSWMKNWNLNREEYLDIRDDRIMWFFDMRGYNKTFDFVVKINTVTAGEFTLPPTIFEAMYNNKFKAVKRGKKVRVLNR